MTDQERIELLEKKVEHLKEMLGTNIAWSVDLLGHHNAQALLDQLENGFKEVEYDNS